MKIKTIASAVLFLSFSITTLGISSYAASYNVIVNTKSELKSLSMSDLRAIYLGRMSTWKGSDQRILMSHGTLSQDSQRSFLDEVIQKSPNSFRRYWRRKLFSGKGTPPRRFSSESQLVSYVREHEGAIGVVSSSATKSGVKVLQVR